MGVLEFDNSLKNTIFQLKLVHDSTLALQVEISG